MAEVCVIYWPSGAKVYASAAWDELPNREGLVPALEAAIGYTDPILVKLIPSNRAPLLSLPKTASVGDDKIDLSFSDLDDEFSALLMMHGEGIRTEIFNYWNAVPETGDPFDLLLSAWRGSVHTPKEYNRPEVKVSAAAGFRSGQLQIPRQPNSVNCTYIFGAHLESQEEIDYHQGCPYNLHLGGDIGTLDPDTGLPWTDCPRRTRNDCFARLTLPGGPQTFRFWPGVEIRPDPIPNNQTAGPNLLAHAIGNQSALGQPIRVIFGYRHAKALILLAFRPEYNLNTPAEGFAAALFEVCKGPVRDMAGFRINDQLVAPEHQQQRLGALGQTPTDWSPDVGSFSGTAHIWGRIQTDVSETRVGDVSGSVHVGGLNNIRVYTDEDSFTQVWTTNRMWCLLEIYCNPQWGYGVDYSRVLMESVIDTAAWCAEVVAMQDPNGNTFGGVRSTFNAELNGRPAAQQIKDVCTAGRIGLPFEWNGYDVFVPLRTETLDESIPEFTDAIGVSNIVHDGAKSSLEWSQISDSELTNQYTVNYDDATNGFFIDTQITFGDQLQQLRAGRAWGDRSRRVINKQQAAFGITNFLEAARFGNTLLYLGPLDSGGIANNLKVKFTTWYSYCFNVQPYKLIRVLNTKLQASIHAYTTARNFSWYEGTPYTYFRVMKIERKGDLKVEIEAQLYPEDYYAALDAPASVSCPGVTVVGTIAPTAASSVTTPAETLPGDWIILQARTEDTENDSWFGASIFTSYNWVNVQEAPTPYQHRILAANSPGSGAQTISVGTLPAAGHYSGIVVRGQHATEFFYDENSAWHGQPTYNPTGPDSDLLLTGGSTPDGSSASGFTQASDTAGHLLVVFTVNPGTTAVDSLSPDGFTERLDSGGHSIHTKLLTAPGDTQPDHTVTFASPVWGVAYRLMVKPVFCDGTVGGELPPIPPQPTTPGAPELELGAETVTGILGPRTFIHGQVAFPAFHLPLRADVFVSFEGGGETLINDNLAPLFGSDVARFTYKPTSGAGGYCFRVTVETAEETPVAGGEVTECITISVAVQIFDRDGEPIVDRDLEPIYDR